ncbi:MAG TPA: DUF885 family protein, partial [Xanthomonadaceae bacterium]|nr:DUF885 family protein [Xanthomonadaceae bacterium]
TMRRPTSLLLALLATTVPALAQAPADAGPDAGRDLGPDVDLVPPIERIQAPTLRMAPVIARYRADRDSLDHFYDVAHGSARESVLGGFLAGWQRELEKIDFAQLAVEDRIDYVLFERELAHARHALAFDSGRAREAFALLPSAAELIELAERRRRMHPQSGREAADVLDRARVQIEAATKKYTDDPESAGTRPVLAYRAGNLAVAVREALKQWYGFHADYDPTLHWWVQQPYEALDKALEAHAKVLREKLAGASDPETIVGDPIGRQALLQALDYEAIPYTPEELVAIARKELAWCHAELARAASELGHRNWRDALEYVKTRHPAPGEQPALVRELAHEAIEFVVSRDLVTVPELARRDWRMNMLSPERQLQAPFFLGGEDVWVAFPTRGMPHEKKLMSLRGNNRHFSRAVVHHELIPGHHLQHFMNERYATHRRLFSTPFWGEGWALYWELRLWELGFAASPEDRIGMLFWRAHRAARILFSLSFHLGEMTPQQAIDLLVEQVGHERENAAAEVRRSFAGDYSPLYQAAYLLGGLQFRALHDELVTHGGMSESQFHDAILQGGTMPVEFVRMRLRNQPPPRGFEAGWRFYDRIEAMRKGSAP